MQHVVMWIPHTNKLSFLTISLISSVFLPSRFQFSHLFLLLLSPFIPLQPQPPSTSVTITTSILSYSLYFLSLCLESDLTTSDHPCNRSDYHKPLSSPPSPPPSTEIKRRRRKSGRSETTVVGIVVVAGEITGPDLRRPKIQKGDGGVDLTSPEYIWNQITTKTQVVVKYEHRWRSTATSVMAVIRDGDGGDRGQRLR